MRSKTFHLLILAALLLTAVSCGGNKPETPETPQTPAETDLSTLPSGNTTVIYEANPKVFAKTGALKSIESNLDRIAALQANVLWLMPIHPVGIKNGVGSPYCVRDYRAVNPDYGTLDDLKSLVRTAHAKGFRVILDWVANHTAWDNAWITEHPDWYTKDVNGNIISPAGMGWNDVADLNYNSTALRTAMKEAMCWWVQEADIDGFRCDYTDGVPTDFWTDAITALKALKGDKLLMLGESGDNKFYASGFDLLYAWSYAGNLPNVFKGSSTVSSLYTVIRSDLSGLTGTQNRMRYIINHDTASENAPASLYKSVDGTLAAFVLSAFLPGVPMIYSSQEVAYAQKINFFNYVLMDWNSNATCTAAYKRIMTAYAETEKYRGSAPQLIENGKVATVYYKAGTRKLLIMVNTDATEVTVKTPMECVGADFKDLIAGTTQTMPSSLTLGGYGYKVYAK